MLLYILKSPVEILKSLTRFHTLVCNVAVRELAYPNVWDFIF